MTVRFAHLAAMCQLSDARSVSNLIYKYRSKISKLLTPAICNY